MKILITYAYAGIGHKKAAEAVRNALREFKSAQVMTVDALDYTNRFFRFSYPRIYLFLINRVPYLWGFFYYLLDARIVDIFLAPIRRFMHRVNSKRFTRFILDEKPDVVISTHFLPSEVISGLKRTGDFRGTLITIVTDFMPHSFWMARDSDYFIVAIEKTKRDLLRRGIKEDRIKVLGIPCDPVFSISKGREQLIRDLGLEDGFFNLLIMGGGFGTGPVREIVDYIFGTGSSVHDKVQVIVICGKNKTLFDELNERKEALMTRLCVFGYMDNIDEFMEASDLIVTKSGGLTVSEALSKKLPMIVIQPIPGQETRNCEILQGYGTALRADNAREVVARVEEFIKFPEKIIEMLARIKLLSYPGAARDIAKFAVSHEDRLD